MPSGSLLQEPDSDGAKSGCGELISKDGYKTTPYKINQNTNKMNLYDLKAHVTRKL